MNESRQTLAQFFEAVYLPAKLADTTANMHYQYRTAIGLFCEYLERNASIDEVTEIHVNMFEQWCWRTGRETNAGKYRRLIAAVMRLARPGEFQPRPAGPPHRPNPDLQPGSLWHFFKTVYQPQRLGAASPASVESYEGAVRLLYRFKESVVMLTDLSDDLIARAMNDLLKKGRAITSFHKFRRTLATVITEKLGIEEARKQLGHSSIVVTAAYVDPSKLSVVHAIDLLPALPKATRKDGAA